MTVLGRLRGVEQRAIRSDDFWAGWASGDDLASGLTDAGVAVTAESALRVTAVFAAVRVLSESVASLPVATFRRQNGLRVPAQRPGWLDRPNPGATRFDLFEQTVASTALTGNAFWWVDTDEVWTLPASAVQVKSGADGRPLFTVTTAGGQQETHAGVADGGNILHFKAFSMPGQLRGMSPVEKAANAVGLAVATEKHGARFFGAGARPGGVLESEHELDTETARQVAQSWKRAHQGSGKSNLPAVLSGGMKWHPDTLSNEASQFLETRKFSVSEIARLFRVPPHMIGDLDRATFSNIEQQSLEFVIYTLRPWLERIEQTMSVLLPPGEFFKFNVEGLLRGDIQSRYEAYEKAVNNGWMSPNEVRLLEDRGPIAAGDEFRQPLNLGPAGSAAADANVLADVASTVRTLTDAGFTPESAVAAATSGDLTRLVHTGRPSVQLQQDES